MRRLFLVALIAAITGCTLPTSNPPTDSSDSRAEQTAEVADSVATDTPFPILVRNEPVTEQDPDEAGTPEDLWERVRAGFSLPDIEHPQIKQQLNWYASHPEYMQRVVQRARPYLYYIVETLEQHDLPMEIALLPIVESAFQPFAYSHGRASGIWQFIPATGRLYGLKQDWWYDGRRDIYASTRAAAKFLKRMNDYYDGDWMHALASYNSGLGNVNRAIRRNKARNRSTDFFALSLPRETQAYVPKLLALKKLIADPQAYGIEIDTIANRPYFTRVELERQIDLAKAAEMANMELDELYRLNPGFNRWATAPDGPHYLLLPVEQAEPFKSALAELPAEQMISWQRHRIRQGETLSGIASRYNTSIRSLKRINQLRGDLLRAGQSLTIPVASQQAENYRLSQAQRTQRKQNRPRKGNKITHVVQPGDTFWGLARRHGVSVRALAGWNAMAPGDPLKPGQSLVIWSRSDEQLSTLNSGQLAAPPTRSMTRRIGYRVRKGDSLARISQKFRVSIGQLRKWNNLPRGKYLQPGQRLTLYVDVMQTSS
ncbi:LysM peptidoglycan-binding domain-containing protein [Thiohalophilus thiocyanatoxydans]|uniref:Membrane-bound lytic murein transglycosylase D n=1 Tax=Thiohalophilus thiocyanatoxydans TaxID=381308 RepID=A0A4R8ISD0_9GAMM|nr:LysM peptidoglycan-binding domain-containing protein [Thiohalophilus thiocyanatoxydans]TDY00083.1 membrane-bound lytic murein transglycosylase D [Thiohalophilus thiocyanatoxydans]